MFVSSLKFLQEYIIPIQIKHIMLYPKNPVFFEKKLIIFQLVHKKEGVFTE